MRAKPVNECPVPNGILMAIGGKENRGEQTPEETQKDDQERLEVLKLFTSLISHKKPSIIIITTASSEGDTLYEEYVRAFTELGGD